MAVLKCKLRSMRRTHVEKKKQVWSKLLSSFMQLSDDPRTKNRKKENKRRTFQDRKHASVKLKTNVVYKSFDGHLVFLATSGS